MAYKIIAHKQRGNTRIISIDTGVKNAQGQPIIETFEWGMDVPIAAVKRETRALLKAKYATPDVELAGVGTDL